MLPDNGDDLQQAFSVVRQPSLTYCLNLRNGRVAGAIDGLEAVKQAVYLALNTDRFTYEIFTPAYGNELSVLAGTSPPLVYAQIRQAIVEALSADDRITAVSGFEFSRKQKVVAVRFTVSTIYGAWDEETEVKV